MNEPDRMDAATSGTDPELDASRLHVLLDLGRRTGKDVLGEVVGLFEAGRTLEKAEAALGDRDIESAARHLHSLKGSAATLGARRLSRLSQELELAILDGAELERLRDDFATLYAARRDALAAIRPYLTSS